MLAELLSYKEKPLGTTKAALGKRPRYLNAAGIIEQIKTKIRENTTPHHVPAKILQVADIPRTKNGKVVELAVKAVVHGMPAGNTDALANPEALELFSNLPALAA